MGINNTCFCQNRQVLSPHMSSAPTGSALFIQSTAQPFTLHSWTSRGDKVTVTMGAAGSVLPEEKKGCDQGPAARQCQEQSLTPSPRHVPKAQAK